MNQLRKVWRYIRIILFSTANREFLVFLFFLALSGTFWLSLTLNDVYEKEFAVPFAVTDIPKNAVLTSNDVDTVKITIRDKGIFLLSYYYGDKLKRISVNFRNYMRNNGTGLVSQQEMQKLIYQRLLSSSKIISVKPERLEFTYNYGAKKRVPVRWSGRVIPEELYFISRVEYRPDSVTIYASDEKLDSINTVYTEPLNYANFRDTLNVTCHLAKMKGVKIMPDHIKIRFLTDVLTEERIEGIPIQGINLPEGKVIRTFPSKVAVGFVTGINTYRNLTPKDFTVVVDYNEIKQNPTEKCRVQLKVVPHGISHAKLEINFVDYLIESE